MQKSQKVLIGVGIGVIAVAAITVTVGPVIYRDMIAEPPSAAPSLSGGPSMLAKSGEQLTATDTTGEWLIGGDSEAGYRVDEVLSGTDVTVTGRTDQVSGSLTVDPDGLTLSAAEITVDVASIATDSAQRDAYFRDTALGAAEHPTATFTLTEPVTLASSSLTSGSIEEIEATGELELAGETRTVTAPLQVQIYDGVAEIAGQIPITFADFDVEAPSLGFVKVAPDGYVEFQLTAERG